MAKKALWTKAFPKQVRRTKKKERRPAPRKRINQISAKRRESLSEYEATKRDWYAQPENQRCLVTGDAKPDVHHTRGRQGDLLCLTELWLPVGRKLHNWTAENPKLAQKLGLLCPAGKWNSQPEQWEIKAHVYRIGLFLWCIGRRDMPEKPQLENAMIAEIETETFFAYREFKNTKFYRESV